MARLTKRLERLATAIDAIPVPIEIERPAFERFRETGELPDERRVASAVVKRCRAGLDDQWGSLDEAALIRHYMARGAVPEDKILEGLYREAVCADGFVQQAARVALRALVAVGFDVTKPMFAGSELEAQLPEWGFVGTWLLGFPERLAVEPCVEQAQRLFARYEELRERTPQSDLWFRDLGAAVRLFRDHGELPRDELLQECVLADIEYTGLLEHKLGHGDAELMAALDALARAGDGEREERLAAVQAMARAGRLAPRTA